MVVFIKFEVENNIDWLVALPNLFGMSWYNNIALLQRMWSLIINS